MAAKRVSASDRQGVVKKIATALKKRYGASVPKIQRPVLETMIYAVCLEDTTHEVAEASFERLTSTFFDLNEIRVSLVREVEASFDGCPGADWRALRVISLLQHVFESGYEFEFEQIRRKTLDLASKKLSKIKNLSPFVRNFTLQTALGSHIVPVDAHIRDALVWLGIVEPGLTVEEAAEAMKSAVRKSDVPLVCHLLRELSNDPKLRPKFESAATAESEDEIDIFAAPARLEELFKAADKRRRTKKKKVARSKRTSAKPGKRTKKKPVKKKVAKKRSTNNQAKKKKKSGRKKVSRR